MRKRDPATVKPRVGVAREALQRAGAEFARAGPWGRAGAGPPAADPECPPGAHHLERRPRAGAAGPGWAARCRRCLTRFTGEARVREAVLSRCGGVSDPGAAPAWDRIPHCPRAAPGGLACARCGAYVAAISAARWREQRPLRCPAWICIGDANARGPRQPVAPIDVDALDAGGLPVPAPPRPAVAPFVPHVGLHQGRGRVPALRPPHAGPTR